MFTVWTPGPGEIEPDRVTADPTVTEDGDGANVIVVEGRVKVVKLVDVLRLVEA